MVFYLYLELGGLSLLFQIAGKLLGKGGDKMRKLKEVAPKLFMSKNDEYFPNTDERVLFIGGSLEQVSCDTWLTEKKLPKTLIK